MISTLVRKFDEVKADTNVYRKEETVYINAEKHLIFWGSIWKENYKLMENLLIKIFI